MKYLAIMFAALFALNVQAEAVVKKVCHEKDGKQVCKTIKTHEKAAQVTTGDPSAPEAKPAKKK